MKTIRISRQGFPLISMCSWMRFFIFVLSKKYNVVLDSENPDIVLCSNLYGYKEGEIDEFMNKPAKFYHENPNVKMLFVSGEIADFLPSCQKPNYWAIGYQKFEHEKYYRMPSYVIDIWTLFDEARITDSPFSWLTEKVNYDKVKNQYKGFCSVTQASHNDTREIIFNKLSEYKQVTSSGPWKQNILFEEGGLNKYQWLNRIYAGRYDGLTYREKIEFFRKYKFNIAVHWGVIDNIVQEKLIHAIAANTIPIFYGNRLIEDEGFNPNKFINYHRYNPDTLLELVKRIDNDETLFRSYIEEPIFVDNKLPDYFDLDRLVSFLDTMINK